LRVDITLRIDCQDTAQKANLFNKLKGDDTHWPAVFVPDSCFSLNQRSLHIKWEFFGEDWDLYALNFIKQLYKEDVVGVFGIACVWGDIGYSGWDEYWSFIGGRLDRFTKWNGKLVSRLLPSYQAPIDMSVINKIRKDRLEKNKLDQIAGIVINEFDFERSKKEMLEVGYKAIENEISRLNIPEVVGEHWQSSDPVWLESRVKEWNSYVLPRLKKNRINVDSIELHKEMFLYGTLLGERLFENSAFNYSLNPFDNKRHDRNFSKALDTEAWPLILIWFHPRADILEPSLKIFLEFILSNGIALEKLRREMNVFFSLPTVGYGAMNGNEEFAMNFLFPSLKRNEIFNFTDNNGQVIKVNLGLGKMKVSGIAFDTQIELIGDARFLPYKPRQFLWKHLSHIMVHEPDLFFPTKDMDKRVQSDLKRTQRQFQSVIARIFDFENRTDASSKRPSTVAMVERLLSKYERKDFSEPMIELWDKTKKNIKHQLSLNKRNYYQSFADVNASRQDLWSQKYQEYLMSKWRQVDN